MSNGVIIKKIVKLDKTRDIELGILIITPHKLHRPILN